ncbi:MAG: hypothetical protein ABI134_33655 [Byssovorax sp.]
MDFEANLGGNLGTKAHDDAAALRALKGELGATGDALKKLHDEAAKATPAAVIPAPVEAPAKRGRGRPRKAVDPDAPEKPKKEPKPKKPAEEAAAATRKPWSWEIGGGLAQAQARTEAYYAKVRALEAGAGKASEAQRSKKAAKEQVDASGAINLARSAALAGGAALGVAGAGGLAKMALGYRGMFALQGISYRLGLSFRSLFSGVNPAPVIRAATAFADQFKKTSVLGAALEGLFSRSFNGLFSGVEKATPYAIAFVQGITLGFLYAENAILRARVALAPYSGILDKATSSVDGLTIAAELGGAAIAALAIKGALAAGPYLAFAAAVMAVAAALDQVNKLSKEWDDNSSSQAWSKFKNDIGVTSDADYAAQMKKRQGRTDGADYKAPPKMPGAAAAAGVDTGAALAAGVVKGMSAGEAAVAAGGARLAKAADGGVRKGGEIRSPSGLTKRTARHFGEGVEEGLDASRAGVQAAADRNLVPDMSGMSSGGARGAGGGGMITVQMNAPLVQVMAGAPADLEAAILRAAPKLKDEIMRLLALSLGVPVGT